MKIKFFATTSVALLVAIEIRASAQLLSEALRGLWKAQWITSPSAPLRDSIVLRFRKLFDIPQTPEHFVVHVSADAQFILCVNQQEIGRGPARSDLAHWRYETYDLAKFLHAGKNEISATVWNFGVVPLAQITDRTGFVLQGHTANEAIANTDNSWEVEEEKGLQTLPTPPEIQRSYYVAEPAERIDGSVFDWSWNNAASSQGRWEKPVSIGYASLRGSVLQNNNWQLTPDPLPPMQMELAPAGRVVRATGVQSPSNFPGSPFEIPAHAKVSLLLDQSHLTTAYPELTVTGGAQSTIRLTHAEAQAAAAEDAARRLGVDVEVLFASGDAVEQSQQLSAVIQSKTKKVSGIVLQPVGTGMQQLASAATAAGIGWVVMHKNVDYIADLRRVCKVPLFVLSTDHVGEGRIQGEQAVALLPDGGTILGILGPATDSISEQRLNGLKSTIQSNMRLLTVRGQMDRTEWLRSGCCLAQALHLETGTDCACTLPQ
jgi:hypothetical protein